MAPTAAQRPVEACVGEDTLCAFADGRLEAREAAQVEEHLARCAACGELVDHAMATSGGFASAERSGARVPGGATPSLAPGAQVGRYVILEPVGAGAMSTVYAAHDPELDRRVALKLLRADGGCDDLRARLYREAKAMARLSHPHVITIYDVGVHGSQLFVAMELVAGGTLRGWLTRAPRSWRAILDAFEQAGRGLASAHAAGLVHRDFKPDNVLVSDDGRVRVTDFGLARASQEAGVATPADGLLAPDLVTTITRTGALVGTPAYMAPEQLRGEATDARADMFGFCVALYEALYGERPYEGRTVHMLRASTLAGVVRPTPGGSDVPVGVRDALLVGLRPRPYDRHASMDALLDALDAAARGDPARPAVGAVARSPRAARRWTAAAVVATAALSLGAALALRNARPALASADVAPAIERDAPPALLRVTAASEAAPAATEAHTPTPSPRAAAASTSVRVSSRPSPRAAPGTTAPGGLGTATLAPPPPTPVTVSSAAPPPAPKALPATASSIGGTATYDRE